MKVHTPFASTNPMNPPIKYRVIDSDTQYESYCDILEKLVFSTKITPAVQDEINLLTLLIETYDKQTSRFRNLDPVQLLKSLLAEHKMKAADLARKLNVSEGLISDILKYKKGMSKKTIRGIAELFKMQQEAFNRPYATSAKSELTQS
jgi:HTH-type transcriptional regulator/antitoxin HigA